MDPSGIVMVLGVGGGGGGKKEKGGGKKKRGEGRGVRGLEVW